MIEVVNFKRPSPSPSRSSVRSDSRVFRQPRVIQVNRDASTMVDGEASGHGVTVGNPPSDCDPRRGLHTTNFRSRTFSDGFIRNTSLELLLGVDCEACIALAAQRQCLSEHISKHDLDLVCNCNIQQNNYLNCHRNVSDHRGHTLNIYDLERIKRETDRSLINVGSHRSLDRKQTRNKSIGVSNYISKQLISYDPRNTLVQKIKRKLSNLKKIGGDAITKKHQNAVQLADIASGSTSSLKKLSMLSIADKPQRRVNSHSNIYPSATVNRDEYKHKASTYANFSGNVDQCFDRLKDSNTVMDINNTTQKIRTFDNNQELIRRNNVDIDAMKFSTLDNRSRCRSIRRQLSYNDFPSDRCKEKITETWMTNENTIESRSTRSDLVDDDVHTFIDNDVVAMTGTRPTHAHCTCTQSYDNRMPSLFYDSQGKKRSAPAPDVTERSQGTRANVCSACKVPQWISTGTTSTTSHSSTTTGNSSREF
ncbi:uncharacterized protein LOC114252742 [Bombyx mandarina]|uniref:Uncharacterized protein LOC114252742 n=1 Tax=Bombyx mandarina TaxID=7092 RepID=A0A6J2KNQ6_BOMMA|nr:uncharacterized protein LOC114252742 [Bombyx mandarina]